MDRDSHDLAQFAPARANIRFRFHAMVTRLHSPRTLSRPRSRNWRNPSTDLMIPNTGSGVCLRSAYERHAANLRKTVELNKAAVFDALASANITSVTVEFDGEGDSGGIEHISA